MKFKVGDRVRVKTGLIAGKVYGRDCWERSMEEYPVVTIEKECNDFYTVEENKFWYTDEMLDELCDMTFSCGTMEQGNITISYSDPVNHPSHYTDGKIEVIDFIEDKNLGFCLGNCIKYISRAGKKEPDKEIQDLKKAKWYLDRYISQKEKEND